ncbi:hypothetical protein R3W88_004948 [Solanum pinnatisectum]|uniref:TCP domain-containing protein n=1 Tax=Solanum pinnatisectum TaxID=50273 RepID=A0AAV9KDC8_9SOLN|nr:hypothetical protein R3W88_004948 [Solanum pinnatisectum]
MINGEVDTSDNTVTKIPKKSSSWTRFKDPRIVRVSRAFGGKDRHSKLGSPFLHPQLYDLQDKLGLDQPSKVVDWLLNEAKHEIDELPPLQMPPIRDQTGLPLTENALISLRRRRWWFHSGSHHGVAVQHEHEEIQNFNVMEALPSTIYNMPLSSQILVYPPARLPQYFFHPHI